jgi:hypothetical protein
MKQATTILLALAVALAGVGAMVGAVGAVSSPDTPYNETIGVDTDTEQLRVTATNITDDSTGTALDVEVFGVTNASDSATRTETSVATGSVSTGTESTSSYTYSGVNSSEYSTYKVSVTSPSTSTNTTAEELLIEKIGVLSGGGGLLGGSGLTAPVVGVGGLGLLYYLMRRDD